MLLQVKPEHAVQAGLGYMKLAQVEAIWLFKSPELLAQAPAHAPA